MKVKLIFFFSIIVVLSSCSVAKRRYNNGFYFDWNTHHAYRLKENISFENEKKGKIEKENLFSINTMNDSTMSINKQELGFPTIHRDSSHLYSAVRTTKRAFNNFYSNHIKLKSTEVQSGKSYDEKNFFQPYLMSPREYLFAALWTFLIGAVFIGLALLFILVIEIEALSLGGILIYFLLIAGGIAVMVVPILLIVALISYLFGY